MAQGNNRVYTGSPGRRIQPEDDTDPDAHGQGQEYPGRGDDRGHFCEPGDKPGDDNAQQTVSKTVLFNTPSHTYNFLSSGIFYKHP